MASRGDLLEDAENDIWMVGDNGTLLHWNGNTLQRAVATTGLSTEYYAHFQLSAIDGPGSYAVAVGESGMVLEFDGSA